MSLVLSGTIEGVLTGLQVQGRIQIDAWGLGVACKNGIYVLNLYSQGQNYPEIIADTAVAGVVKLLTAAHGSGANVYYWPSETDSVLFVGNFLT